MKNTVRTTTAIIPFAANKILLIKGAMCPSEDTGFCQVGELTLEKTLNRP
jgi:hypothetical protein